MRADQHASTSPLEGRVGAPRTGRLWRLCGRVRCSSSLCCGIALLFLADRASGQPTTNNIPSVTNAPPSLEQGGERKWSFSASASAFSVPDAREYVQPTLTADRGWLHLEARYNYEDLDTGSAWVGYNFSGGDKLSWEFTPMLGGVFGHTTGVAPGYEGTLRWWKLELYSEGEYVFDTASSSDSFFYNWSELTLAPVDWFRFGLATQRTRVYENDRDIQRGVLVGFTWKRLDFTTSVLNPDDKPTWIFGVTLSF